MKLADFDLKTVLLILIGIVCAVVWGLMAYENESLRADLLIYAKSTLIFIVGHALGISQAPTTPNP